MSPSQELTKSFSAFMSQSERRVPWRRFALRSISTGMCDDGRHRYNMPVKRLLVVRGHSGHAALVLTASNRPP